ncbi:hypothetical protein J2X69_004832 [Algoriphagus sp. 4150]|nr:hypothetical protein [Algoriphagus sp. 4150]
MTESDVEIKLCQSEHLTDESREVRRVLVPSDSRLPGARTDTTFARFFEFRHW